MYVCDTLAQTRGTGHARFAIGCPEICNDARSGRVSMPALRGVA